MRRFSGFLGVGLGVALAASCGGSFSTGGGPDAGDDGTSPSADASGDTTAADTTSSGDGSPTEGGGADAADETSPPDAPPPDVAEEQSPPPPACGGTLACVPAVPTGWSGPVEIYSGPSPVPACTSAFTSSYDGNASLDAPAATCSCSCDQSVTECAPTTVTLSSAACVAGVGCTCQSKSCSVTTLQEGACTTIDGATSACSAVATFGMSLSAPAVSGGTCAPNLDKQVPPTSWATYAQACAPTVMIAQANCQTGSVCAPKPAAPYGSTLCVSQAGDVACPTQGYTTKQTFYGGVDDDRSCTACTCGSPTGAGCAATVGVFPSTNGSCTGNEVSYNAPVSCDAVNQTSDYRLSVSAENGTCTPASVTPTGAATPATPTTFCCLP